MLCYVADWVVKFKCQIHKRQSERGDFLFANLLQTQEELVG